MSEVLILVLLYAAGGMVLVSEIFIPSHGLLSIVGIGFLIAAIAKTFDYAGGTAGTIAVFACLVTVPTFAFLAVKYWRMTPIGRRMAPLNPVATVSDTGVAVEELAQLIGQIGVTASPLRPVGTCEFNGKRVSCIAEFGMIDAGVAVEGIRISGSNLAVQETKRDRGGSVTT